MPKYTENFSEANKVLAHDFGVGVTTEQNSAWIQMSLYHRLAVVIHALVVGTTFDVDIEIATDASGSNLFTLYRATQLVAADDNNLIIFEIRGEKLGHPTGAPAENYDFVRVEITPSGAATYSSIIYGNGRYQPATLTLVDEVID